MGQLVGHRELRSSLPGLPVMPTFAWRGERHNLRALPKRCVRDKVLIWAHCIAGGTIPTCLSCLLPCGPWLCHSDIVPIHSRAIQALLVTGGYSSALILTRPGAFVGPHLPVITSHQRNTCTAPLTGMGDPGRAAAEDLSLTHTHCTVIQPSVFHSVEVSDLQVAPSDVHSGVV